MKRYQCHKVVEALRIAHIEQAVDDTFFLSAADGENVRVTREWFARHEPASGGYFVKYADGYTSYSPAQSFEEWYVPEMEDTFGVK